jgi:O-antigen/teichoic acid export membrane protein
MIKTISVKVKEKFFSGNDVRSSRMNKNIIIMILVRGLSILVSLLFVPLYLKSIDRSDYGILLTLTSMINWIGMLDIGFGNGLRNKLTISISNNNMLDAKKYVSNAYAAISVYIILIAIVFLSISHLFSWSSILNTSSSRENEMYILVNVTFILFCFNFIFGILNTILFSTQQPAIQSIINLISQIISFVVVLIAIKLFEVKSILIIGILTTAVSPLVLLIASIVIFSTKYKFLIPRLKLVCFDVIKDILTLGSKFFVLQIITLILFSINNMLILHLAGSEAVVEYSIAYRYIDVLAIVFTIFVTPVWSAATDAFAKDDKNWIKITVKKMLTITFIIFIGGIIMIVFSNFIFKIWLGEGIIKINHMTLILVLLFVLFRMLYQSYGYIINGSGKLKAQMSITLISAILYIPAALLLGGINGLYGVLLVSVGAQIINYIWAQKQFKHIINNTGGKFWHE